MASEQSPIMIDPLGTKLPEEYVTWLAQIKAEEAVDRIEALDDDIQSGNCERILGRYLLA